MEAWLALEDGTVYKGESFGATGETTGEVVFNTSMIGYQEILTDPSYKGQIVTMTYPMIGNYGVNPEDLESICPHVEGFIVKEYQPHPSSWRSKNSLSDFLSEHDVIGITGIDTRALTRRLRVDGVMRGIITTEDLDQARVKALAKDVPSLVGVDMVREVSTKEPYKWEQNSRIPVTLSDTQPDGVWQTFEEEGLYRVVVMDYGAKHNILRCLSHRGCQVLVLPADSSAELVLRLNPDGIMLSNGPGDPDAVDYAIAELKSLIDQKPIFGICIGHQLLGLALGGKRFKLKFGHRGANQPVQQVDTGKVEITSQNHGFAIDADSLDTSLVELTHINLNDRTLEGIAHRRYPVFSVQYHPEASPGPHDANHLFDQFIESMNKVPFSKQSSS
jgi:carbamoyl-phosphate synthase small subunit